MKELCNVLEEMLPPGVAPPTPADFQHLSAGGVGSPRKPAPLLASPKSPMASRPDATSPPRGLSMQEQLNQISSHPQPGSYPHGGGARERGHHPKHAAFHH